MKQGRKILPCFFNSVDTQKGQTMETELKSGLFALPKAEKECDIYCPICHKMMHVEAGQVIPRCCGKPMQVME